MKTLKKASGALIAILILSLSFVCAGNADLKKSQIANVSKSSSLSHGRGRVILATKTLKLNFAENIQVDFRKPSPKGAKIIKSLKKNFDLLSFLQT